ncbi:hypothetical protein AVEN_191762-1 [Araneus ventricosus]|uniref:Uncharacterized protein n=1 Tax=Araneus ventricosus TaxID=182803 RepID=A0A4Y2TT01_ARAVE|nr:hypothetical protein AVEN_191762-1 [Araneus ventricosus]
MTVDKGTTGASTQITELPYHIQHMDHQLITLGSPFPKVHRRTNLRNENEKLSYKKAGSLFHWWHNNGSVVLSSTKSKSPLANRKSRTIHGKGRECSFCCHWTLDARGKKSDFVHCLYGLAGYNGMAFTLWVTLPGEKLQTCIAHSTQGHNPRHDEAA